MLDLMNERMIDKAIPGGKYGCALLLQFYYPNLFSNIPVGKLIALVKKSLQEQLFCHYKTLIYENRFSPKT